MSSPTIVSNWDALKLAMLNNFGIVIYNDKGPEDHSIGRYYAIELYGQPPNKMEADPLNQHPMISKVRMAQFLDTQGYIEFNETTEEWRIIPSNAEDHT